MTRRLLLSYVGLAVLILLVLEIPLGVIAYRHERDVAVAQATRDASGLAVESAEHLEAGDVAGLDRLLRDYRAHTGAEVAVVAASGRLLAGVGGDADADTAAPSEGQVRAALSGREVGTVTSDEGRAMAVAAVPIGAPGHPAGAVEIFSPVGAYTDHAHDIWLALAAFGAGVLAITLLIGLWLARGFARPLASLEEAVAALGAGRLASRADAGRGPSEVRALAEQFNRMAARLQELISAQSRFVADASHQLRSPLTALRLRLENLEAELDPAAAEPLAAAGQEVQRLSRLVDGLLTLSRADGAVPETEPVEVGPLIAERCGAWEALAAERSVGLVSADLVGRPVVVALVAGDLEQILDNLLANALDASPAGSTITVRLEAPRRDRVAVHVIDEGPGLDEASRAAAFDRFWQGPQRRGGHSGLGLAIVRQLVERNGGGVELAPAPGAGLDATIRLTATVWNTSQRGQRDPAGRRRSRPAAKDPGGT